MAELKYKDITQKIIAASFEVHKFLGNGFQEVIYHRALTWELSNEGLPMQKKLNKRFITKNFHRKNSISKVTFKWLY